MFANTSASDDKSVLCTVRLLMNHGVFLILAKFTSFGDFFTVKYVRKPNHKHKIESMLNLLTGGFLNEYKFGNKNWDSVTHTYKRAYFYGTALRRKYWKKPWGSFLTTTINRITTWITCTSIWTFRKKHTKDFRSRERNEKTYFSTKSWFVHRVIMVWYMTDCWEES